MDGVLRQLNTMAPGALRDRLAARLEAVVQDHFPDDDTLPARGLEFMEGKARREAELRDVQAERELAELRPTPMIDANSARIASCLSRGDTFESLFQDAERQRVEREELQEAVYQESCPGHPAITRQAAELVREGAVGDRLYRQARERQLARDNAEKGKAGLPVSSQRPSACALEHAETMHRRAIASKLALKERKEREIAEAAKRAHPHLSTRSRQIAADLAQSSRERLLKPKSSSGSSLLDDPELTFAPKISAKSRKLVQHKRDPVSEATSAAAISEGTHGRLHRDHQERLRRRIELASHSSRDAIELGECTFQPQTTASAASFATAHYPGTEPENPNESVEDRLLTWKRRREAKISARIQKKQAEDRDESECTFRPRINATCEPSRTKQSPSRRPLRGGEGGDGTRVRARARNGYDRFLARQQQGRAERARRSNVPHATGASWTGELTVARAPMLGTEQRCMRKQVRRPKVSLSENTPTTSNAEHTSSKGRRRMDRQPPDVDMGRVQAMAAHAAVRAAASGNQSFSPPTVITSPQPTPIQSTTFGAPLVAPPPAAPPPASIDNEVLAEFPVLSALLRSARD